MSRLEGLIKIAQIHLGGKKMEIKVYDNGRTADRYTILIGDEVYQMSSDSNTPNGYNMYVGRVGGDQFETGFPETRDSLKKIRISDLPKQVLLSIIYRLEWEMTHLETSEDRLAMKVERFEIGDVVWWDNPEYPKSKQSGIATFIRYERDPSISDREPDISIIKLDDGMHEEKVFTSDLTLDTAKCVICGSRKPVCCDEGYEITEEGIQHASPVCRGCCTCKHRRAIWDGKLVAGGTYLRGG
jgi:hypothetical protein